MRTGSCHENGAIVAFSSRGHSKKITKARSSGKENATNEEKNVMQKTSSTTTAKLRAIYFAKFSF